MTTLNAPLVRIGVLWAGDPDAPTPDPEQTRLRRIFEELVAHGAAPVPVVYHDVGAVAVRDRLLALDGVLVWVDPIVDGRTRAVLDALLRDVSAKGVFVSAHPDVILKMGTKDVLYRTRGMAWGTDTLRYATWEELAEALAASISLGPRVLKQHRGNGGNGVWKVELSEGAGHGATVRVQHALRGAHVETLRLDEFVERCRPYFAGGGGMISQPYQARLSDGMIRCYFVHDRVVGFGQQLVTALLPPPPGAAGPPDPGPRLYYDAARPEFQRLRTLLESGWVAEMQRLLGIDTAGLPVVWDADFLLGPKASTAEDTYVLCEINVSSVFPIPDEAPSRLTAAAVARVLEARSARNR